MRAWIDVLVVGGGVAGLAAALSADVDEVVVFEAQAAPGGAALLSNGSLWTYPDLGSYLENCPGAKPSLAERVIDGLPAVIDLLRGLGVAVEDRGPSLYGADRSYRVVPSGLVDRLAETARVRGAVVPGRRVTAISEVPEGVVVTTDDGRETRARSVVLATGGIHADDAMLHTAGLEHYVGLPVRNRKSSGDGVRLALEKGAAIAGTADGIYGHLVPTGLTGDDARSPLAAQYQSQGGVLVAMDGALLAGPGTDDHHLNRLLSRRSPRRAVLFFDAAAAPPHIRRPVGGADWARDRRDFAAAHGRRSASAETLDELQGIVAGWGGGVPSEEAVAAMADALMVPPFAAIEVEPSITHAGAGIDVDDHLRATGLRNVFVAGADIGNGFGDGYGGGLSFALATGVAAGHEAAAHAARLRSEDANGETHG